MFRKEKNEQNENILYLSSILNYHIMFTIFRFHFLFKNSEILNIIRDGTGKAKNRKNQKIEHYDF